MPYILIDKENNITDCLPEYVEGSIKIEDTSAFNTHKLGFGGFKYIDSIFEEIEVIKDTPPKAMRVINGSEIKDQMGYFGNVWFRKLHFESKHDVHEGHKHKHDHMSLLTNGRVLVEVDGCKPVEFLAPASIIVSANKKHKITALDDNTTWWCIFAMRDNDGELTELYNSDMSPYDHLNDG